MKQFLLFIVTIAILSVPTMSMAQDIDHIKDLIEDGKYQQAARMLRPLADGGNSKAQYLAATLFLKGKGVVKNPRQAFKYAKMAADNTEELCEDGILLTSWMYYEGLGVNKNIDMATTYARELKGVCQLLAAKKLLGENIPYFDNSYPIESKGLAFIHYELLTRTNDRNSYNAKLEAFSALSKMCYEGIGTKKDTAQAIRYATLMCKDVQNYFHLDKEYQKLAQYYKEQSDTMYFRVLAANTGIKGDIATQRSEGISMKKELIQCYLNGKGCQRDEAMAVQMIEGDLAFKRKFLEDPVTLEVYNRVKTQGNIGNLGKFIDQNYDVNQLLFMEENYEKTGQTEQQKQFQNWLKQAEGGSLSAMWMVSVLYEKGIGTSVNVAEARRWANKACKDADEQHWQGDRNPLWKQQEQHLQSIPLTAGEILFDDKIVVYSKTNNSTYTDRRGKTTYRSYVSIETIDIAIKQFTAKEIEEELKEKKRTLVWRETLRPNKLSPQLKIYAKVRKEIGQPMPEGKYWAFSGEWRNEEVLLLNVNADGEIIATNSIKDLSKSEKEQPYYFLVEKQQAPTIKQGEPIIYYK